MWTDLAAIGTNAWARPGTDERGEATAVILAVLKAFGSPTPQGHVRLAALCCLDPRWLDPFLTDSERVHWRRATGSEPFDGTAEWGAATGGLRARGHLVEDLELGTWTLGDPGDIVTEGWPDGRAGFAVAVLRRGPLALEKGVVPR